MLRCHHPFFLILLELNPLLSLMWSICQVDLSIILWLIVLFSNLRLSSTLSVLRFLSFTVNPTCSPLYYTFPLFFVLATLSLQTPGDRRSSTLIDTLDRRDRAGWLWADKVNSVFFASHHLMAIKPMTSFLGGCVGGEESHSIEDDLHIKEDFEGKIDQIKRFLFQKLCKWS